MKDAPPPQLVALLGPTPASLPLAGPLPRGVARRLLTLLGFVWHRRWRVLVVLALLVPVGLGLAVAALLLWTDYHLRAARQAVERGHNAVAARHLQACRRFRPDHPEALLLSACIARRGGGWSEAETLLDRYWQLKGDDDALVLARILLRATRGEVEAVEPLLQARIDRDDATAAAARESLIAGLLYRYRLPDADTQISHWLEHDPNSTTAWLSRGKWNEQSERFSDAVQAYRQTLKLDSEHDEARLRMTTVLLQLSQGEEALTHLRYLRRSLPENPEVQVQLARALEFQAQTDEARATLDECLRASPDYAPALAERGRIARGDRDYQKAEEYLKRAVQLDPGDKPARYQYFGVLNENHKPAEAAREEEALRQLESDLLRMNELVRERLPRKPHDPAIPYEVAMIVLRAGRPNEALRWLLNALQVDPQHAPTHRALAAFYHESGNPVLAARHRALAQQFAASGAQGTR